MKTLLALLLIYSPISLFSQDTLQYEWMMTRPSPLSLGNSEGWAIGVDDNDAIYWGVNQDMPGTDIYMDATVYKFDMDTNELWMEHAVSYEFAQQSYNLKVTDSLLFVGGRTCATAGVDSCQALFFTNNLVTGNTEQTTLWTQGYGYEEIDGIHLENDGIILTGWTRSDTTAIDVLLLKIDYQGNEIWRNIWGSQQVNRDDHQDGHIVVDDSMIYISGLSTGSPGLGFQGKAMLAKFDKTNGNFVDSVLYGRNDIWINAENALGMTTDGDYLYCTGVSTTQANNWDIFLTKYDKDFNRIWYTTWGGPSGESARSVHVAADGNIYIVGNTESYGNGDMDVVFLKFDPTGVVQWYKTWGKSNADQTLDFYVDNADFYITGKTKSYHPFARWEAFLLKVNLDTISNSITEFTNADGFHYAIYPNPFDKTTTLKFDNPKHENFELEIVGLDGKIWRRLSNINSEEVEIEKSDMSAGVYLLKLTKQNQLMLTEKLIIQ